MISDFLFYVGNYRWQFLRHNLLWFSLSFSAFNETSKQVTFSQKSLNQKRSDLFLVIPQKCIHVLLLDIFFPKLFKWNILNFKFCCGLKRLSICEEINIFQIPIHCVLYILTPWSILSSHNYNQKVLGHSTIIELAAL